MWRLSLRAQSARFTSAKRRRPYTVRALSGGRQSKAFLQPRDMPQLTAADTATGSRAIGSAGFMRRSWENMSRKDRGSDLRSFHYMYAIYFDQK